MTIQKQPILESTFSVNPSPDVFFNVCFDKNHLKSVIAWFLDHYGEKKTLDLVETFKQVGFHQATLAGVSLGVDDLQIPPQKAPLLSQAYMKREEVTQAIQTGNLTSVEKSQRLIDTWNQTSETLRQAAVHNFRMTNPVNPVYMMAFSGARGNISQVRQLVAMRGLMADPQGAILEFPIQSNFREGLTVSEYMISCYGARKGLVDTALRTATSGYLTRRLVDAVQHVVIYVTDCGTKKGIVIQDTNVEQRLIGRVLLKDVVLESNVVVKRNTLISPRLANQIARKHKQVLIRSPLTCQTEKSVCQLCYGLDLGQGKLVSLGEAVGIIAAQSIGEPGTQLTMRTFHTGGVGVFSEQAMKSFTAPFDGKIEFLESLAGLFVRTPYGNIVYLLKHKTLEKTKPILRLISSHPGRKSIVYEIQQGEVPANSLLWVKQGESVKTGQLLVQASRLEKASQEMPESIHPVRAPFSGEIFLGGVRYLTVEHQTKKKKDEKKENSPLIPTLKELGNFWVFSTCIQKESQSQFLNKFFKKGDLFSLETPINQQNLELACKAQLRLVDSSLVYGYSPVNIMFSKIHYSGSFYFFSKNGENTSKSYSLFIYTTNSKSTRLIWYPSVKKEMVSGSSEKGYSCFFDFDTESLFNTNSGENQTQKTIQNQSSETKEDLFTKVEFLGQGVETEEKLEGTNSEKGSFYHQISSKFGDKTGVSQRPENGHSQYATCVLSPHGSFVLKPLACFETQKPFPLSCLIVTGNDPTLSKSGVFQIEDGQEPKWSKTSTFVSCFVKNSLVPFQNVRKSSSFLQKALKQAHKVHSFRSGATIIQKQQSWVCVPGTEIRDFVPSEFPGVILEPGKQFEFLSFPNSYVSTNLICRKIFFLLKSKTKTQRSSFWYSLEELGSPTKQFPTDLKQKIFTVCNFFPPNFVWWDQKTSFSRRDSLLFCFYKKQIKNKDMLFDSVSGLPVSQKQFFANLESKTRRNVYQEFQNIVHAIKTKRRLSHLILFQKNSQKILPNRASLKQEWLIQKKQPVPQNKVLFPQNEILFSKIANFWDQDREESSWNSPLFIKQRKTHFQPGEVFEPSFEVVPSFCSKWGAFQSVLKVELEFDTPKIFKKQEHLKQEICLPKNKKSEENSKGALCPPKLRFWRIGFSIFFYRGIRLTNASLFDFRTFHDGWVLPEYTVTQAFVKANTLGEFRRLQVKRDDLFLSFLRDKDVATLKLPIDTKDNPFFPILVGQRVRWGQELCEGFATPVSGQILKATGQTLTIRKGLPLLASRRGLVHIQENDLVEKNDLLMTLRSKRLQTEDIVQGIPKIEQLFEARETQGGQILKNNIHRRLNLMFRSALQRKPFFQAVEWSVREIQKFLVESILEAYSNQGVHIAEKHVEVVVRQMTARVRILRGGDTGFLPGEFVQQRMIEQINVRMRRLGRRRASYEPVVLGITKSVLQSESFLLAVGFQQVSQVLVRSALSKKTDFLRGLHENIMVGQPMPAGTALVPLKELKKSSIPPVTEPLVISADISGTENQFEAKEDFVDIIAQSSETGAPQVPSMMDSVKKTSKSRKQKVVANSAETGTKKRTSQKNKRLEEGNEPSGKKTKPRG